MNLEVTRLSLESGDMARWSAVARDLGRHLAAELDRSKTWLLSLRRLLARLKPQRTSDYERGFLDALELVATGFERRLDDVAADETELSQLRSRPAWVAALRLIDDGVTRPSDLARRLGVQPSAVTKVVDELEDADLVTQTTQGRERPCRLTPRARVLLPRLPPPVGGGTEAAKVAAEVVSRVVTCTAALVRDRRVARARLRERLRGASAVEPDTLLELMESSLRHASCAFLDIDDAWVATDAELFSRLRQHLALACRGQPGTLLEVLTRLGEHGEVVLRVGNGVSTWDSAVGSRSRIRVIRGDELKYGMPLPTGEFQIVYESASLLVEDREVSREWVTQASAQAIGRYYFAVGPDPGIPHFNPIEVDVPEYAP